MIAFQVILLFWSVIFKIDGVTQHKYSVTNQVKAVLTFVAVETINTFKKPINTLVENYLSKIVCD